MKIEKIRITGFDQTIQVAAAASDAMMQMRGSYLVGQTTRGETQSHEIELKDDDIIEMVFEDGTTWFSSPYTLEEIFPEATVPLSRGIISSFEIPQEIGVESAERGIFNKVTLKVFNIFAKKTIELNIEQLAAKLEDKQLNSKIGLFKLNPNFQLNDFIAEAGSKPFCLFIHGTASSIEGSFGEARDTALMKFIQNTYGDSVLAFQHRTLTESPLQNVKQLVKALPQNCVLHLITSSRGGLVGELLSRFCNENEIMRGFTETELAILKKEYPEKYYESIEKLTREIKEDLKNKRIIIEKFIRIACPAGGTTLASKRLDNFFNITFNLIGLGTGLTLNPVYSAFKNLIAAVIDSKNKAGVLPGLEVQSPDSPFIRVLNSVADPSNPTATMQINNSLVVIAGNSKPELKISALLIIASKLFFQRENDLVVDTQSMRLGTRRTGKVQQFFYQDTDINHFRYFANRTTNNAILLALETKWGDKLPGFTEEQLSISVLAERNAVLKLDGGQVFRNYISGSRPIVVLLPGIMGSNLSLDNTLLWINYWKFITGGLRYLQEKNVEATSLVSTSYKLLVEYLEESYDVVTFPFDWRLSLVEAADKLDAKLQELMHLRQPIKIIGHSMGGVLVRDFMVTHRDTWTKLNNSNGFRLIFLGSPLGGSFRIAAVLFGMDGIITKLSKIDQKHSKQELVEIFAGFKGILSLLPFSTGENNDFSSTETWQYMKKGLDESSWPLPSNTDLQWFAEYRDLMMTGIQDDDYLNAVYIAGKDKSTPCGYRIDTKGNESELVFLSTAEGDQSVTWETGIPAKMIGNNSVYYVDVTHGSLANEPDMFKGIGEILTAGSTNLFRKKRPSVRGIEKLFRSPEYRDFDLSLAGIENTLLGLGAKTTLLVSEPPIKVSISQGDLFYSRYPIMAGHFEDDGILYAEKTIDEYLNGQLRNHHQLGIYPGEIGSSDVFLSENTSFRGAIIIGLGSPGKLTASELIKSIEQGVANYLLHLGDSIKEGDPNDGVMAVPGISSLIIGCGYAGLSIEDSIKAIIQGVQNANVKVRNLKLEKTQAIEQIEFVELYEDKAVSCLYSISRIEKEETRSFRICKERPGIKMLLGSKRRISAVSSEGWWNRISVTREIEDNSTKSLKFNASTNGSRAEEKELLTTPALMEGIIEEISTNNQWSPERAKTIFELLIPNDFKEQLKRHGNVNWILDEYTASYPWELLQDGIADTKPICISAGMIRQLSTRNYRTNIKAVPKNTALIIADPDLKGFVNQLPGALKEGQLVTDLLTANGMEITTSFKGNHPEIIEKLFRDDYKIIHLSGHGIYNEDISKGSGMVIGKNLYLSTREINQMSSVPELVFVNCCHLGKTDGVAEQFYHQRYKLAANIGTQLIENGVKCVIAAGWAVNDDAALEFARVFYDRMLNGSNFGESVMEARKTVYDKFGHTNTWGAYQCYGDPFYKFEHLPGSNKSEEKTYLIAQEAEVDLMNLLQDIEIGKFSTSEYLKILTVILTAIEKAEIRNCIITEKEALIYQELGEYDLACVKYSGLLSMEDATFSFSVAEKYCHVRIKQIIQEHRKDPKKRNEYMKRIKEVIEDLQILINLSPTSERLNMLGNTYKSLAFLSNKSGKSKANFKAAAAYHKAYTNFNNWYSLANWLALESTLIRSGFRTWNSDRNENNDPIGYTLPSKVDAVNLLDNTKTALMKNPEQMSYWDMLACLNIRVCKFIILFSGTGTQTDVENILQEISTLWKLAGSKGKRFAEIEHLEFIIDALSMVENPETLPLKTKLDHLKNDLLKLI